jgi:hypothetical protein
MASRVREIPLIMSMLFGEHKRLMGLEKRSRSDSMHDKTMTETGAENETELIHEFAHRYFFVLRAFLASLEYSGAIFFNRLSTSP